MRDEHLLYCVCILTPLAVFALMREPKQTAQECISPTYNTKNISFTPSNLQTNQNDNAFIDTIPTYTNKSLERMQEHVIHKTR